MGSMNPPTHCQEWRKAVDFWKLRITWIWSHYKQKNQIFSSKMSFLEEDRTKLPRIFGAPDSSIKWIFKDSLPRNAEPQTGKW